MMKILRKIFLGFFFFKSFFSRLCIIILTNSPWHGGVYKVHGKCESFQKFSIQIMHWSYGLKTLESVECASLCFMSKCVYTKSAVVFLNSRQSKGLWGNMSWGLRRTTSYWRIHEWRVYHGPKRSPPWFPSKMLQSEVSCHLFPFISPWYPQLAIFKSVWK